MTHALTVLLAAVAVATSPVAAASLTNRDASAHKLVIVEGASRREQTVKPAETLADVCPKGCLIHVGEADTEGWSIEGPEVVSIEGGLVYFDRSDAETPAPKAPPGAPSPPRG